MATKRHLKLHKYSLVNHVAAALERAAHVPPLTDTHFALGWDVVETKKRGRREGPHTRHQGPDKPKASNPERGPGHKPV